MRVIKYDYQPGIDTYWDDSYRFTLKWDASDALKNRTQRLYRDMTKMFDDDYSQSASRLAAKHYATALRGCGKNADERSLRDAFDSLLSRYRMDCWDISLEELRDRSRIEKGYNGLYNYELPVNLIEKYKKLYFKSLTGFYNDAYNYVCKHY